MILTNNDDVDNDNKNYDADNNDNSSESEKRFFDNDTNNYNYDDDEDDDSEIMIQKFSLLFITVSVKFNCKDYILLKKKLRILFDIWRFCVRLTCYSNVANPEEEKKEAIITVKLLSLHFLLQRITYINWLKLFFDNSASLKTSKFNFFLKMNLPYFCFCITRIRE